MIDRITFDGLSEVRGALQRLGDVIRSGDAVSTVGRQITEEATKVLMALTPRQQHQRLHTRGAHAPLFEGWFSTVVTASKGAFFEAQIRNLAAHDAGKVILYALESGAVGHPIAPRNAKRLSWLESGDQFRFGGRTSVGAVIKDAFSRQDPSGRVFRRLVEHPGNRPFAMVAHALDQMQLMMPAYANLLGQVFGNVWSGGPAAISVRVSR